jgi:general secretion pathway protein G
VNDRTTKEDAATKQAVVNVVTANKQRRLMEFFRGSEMKARSGFTLVEILIVVVILGILAAIVIPQFTEASTEAKASSLISDLQTMRSQIELYKIQHDDLLPGQATATDVIVPADFVTALTTAVVYPAVTGKSYGPYLQKIPTNQFVNGNGINAANGSTGTTAQGWTIDTTTGVIKAVAGGAYPATLAADTDVVEAAAASGN